MTEIVMPRYNEKEFIETAARLNLKRLCFLYDFDKYMENIQIQKSKDFESERVLSHTQVPKFDFDVDIGFTVNQKNINSAFSQSKLLVVKSSDRDIQFLESRKIMLIYGHGENNKRDYLHQRASGLNHAVCELARKNNAAIGFSYSSLLDKSPELAALLMGRMMQNISLCHKYKVKTIISSFSSSPFDMRSPYDIKSLFTMLGMESGKIRDSLNYDF